MADDVRMLREGCYVHERTEYVTRMYVTRIDLIISKQTVELYRINGTGVTI